MGTIGGQAGSAVPTTLPSLLAALMPVLSATAFLVPVNGVG